MTTARIVRQNLILSILFILSGSVRN
jgi:hypothetical protein